MAVSLRLSDPNIFDLKVTKIVDGENESLLTYSRLINRCRLFASHQFPFHSRLQLWRSEKKTRQIGLVRTISYWIKKVVIADSTLYMVIARNCHLQVYNFQRSSSDHKAISLHQISISICLLAAYSTDHHPGQWMVAFVFSRDYYGCPHCHNTLVQNLSNYCQFLLPLNKNVSQKLLIKLVLPYFLLIHFLSN